MPDDLAACADLVRRGDPERFRAVMAAPVRARENLFVLYAFNVEVARAPWLTAEPMIAEMRLQWWRDALAEIGRGGPVRRHVVTTPLARIIGAHEAALLDELVAARRWDIARAPFEDIGHFRRHIAATAGNLLVVATRALGGAPEEPVRAGGFALGLANWLRAVPALRAAGRVPLVDGRPEAVRALAEEGIESLAGARAARATIPRAARPAMLALFQAGPVLAAARARPALVAEGGLGPAPFRDRLTLIARVASGVW